jgi:hypothetical protein
MNKSMKEQFHILFEKPFTKLEGQDTSVVSPDGLGKCRGDHTLMILPILFILVADLVNLDNKRP